MKYSCLLLLICLQASWASSIQIETELGITNQQVSLEKQAWRFNSSRVELEFHRDIYPDLSVDALGGFLWSDDPAQIDLEIFSLTYTPKGRDISLHAGWLFHPLSYAQENKDLFAKKRELLAYNPFSIQQKSQMGLQTSWRAFEGMLLELAVLHQNPKVSYRPGQSESSLIFTSWYQQANKELFLSYLFRETSFEKLNIHALGLGGDTSQDSFQIKGEMWLTYKTDVSEKLVSSYLFPSFTSKNWSIGMLVGYMCSISKNSCESSTLEYILQGTYHIHPKIKLIAEFFLEKAGVVKETGQAFRLIANF